MAGKRKSSEIDNGERVTTLTSPKTETKQSNYCLMSKFTWKIEHFSRLDAEKPYSRTYDVNEYKWRLLLYSKGNDGGHLSLYLGVADPSTLPIDWRIPTKFSLALVNQIDPKKTIKKETKHTFNVHESDWGFNLFVPLREFHDKVGGFLVNDMCLIEAEVYVPDPSPCVANTSPAPPDQVMDSSVGLDPVESVYARVQSVLKSLPKKPSSSLVVSDAICSPELPSSKYRAASAKEIFDKLISYPLDDLADPKHETAMSEALSILNNNLSLFSNGEAKEITALKATFPQMMLEWRESVKVKGGSDHLWTAFEKTKSLLEDLLKTEDGIRAKLEDLSKKEMDLKAQMEAIECDRRHLREERGEVSKLTRKVCSLAEEQGRKIEGKETEVETAKKKMEDLKSQWDATKRRLSLRKNVGSAQ
ncbi:hypothetical protein DM860_000274 [Cuscuta australis]|uniref:MATH domain-containing protein n=1 Tax=Cuscuta australis TaxID=267555 RepID=A0A328CY32_9ASTE|nr:hypothetical protein DM860_000274 [Cuscuta australis]